MNRHMIRNQDLFNTSNATCKENTDSLITSMECCKNPAQYNMHEFRYEIVDGRYVAIPCWNRICTNCFTHWHGHPNNLKRYTKYEWDLYVCGWINKNDLMPEPNNKEIKVLCSDGKARNAYAAEIGGFMVNTTMDFAENCLEEYEVTHWKNLNES